MRLKFHLYILAVFICCLHSCKNDKKTSQDVVNTEGVTSSVEQAFKKRYPNISEVYWDSLDNGFSAMFNDGTADYKVNYDFKGVFQNQIKLIESVEALPPTIQTFLNKHYKEANIAILQWVDNDKTQIYQIELESDTDYITLEFDRTGKLINEVKEPFSNDELQEQEEEGVEKEGN